MPAGNYRPPAVAAELDRSRQPVQVALADALDGALEGSGRLVLLTGDAGIGKTTMARGGVAHAPRAGAAVRWAACWPGGATVAHGPWLTVLAGLGPAARAAVEALAGTAPEDSAAAASLRASAYAAVLAALADA